MMGTDRRGALIGSAALLAAALLWSAAGAQAPPPQPDYHPSMGDLMTMAVQPRHTKLGIAGRARNWPYAAYAEVTDACNVCHRSLNHDAVVIKAPDAAAYPDQDFRPH